jgi:hypothetical protein
MEAATIAPLRYSFDCKLPSRSWLEFHRIPEHGLSGLRDGQGAGYGRQTDSAKQVETVYPDLLGRKAREVLDAARYKAGRAQRAVQAERPKLEATTMNELCLGRTAAESVTELLHFARSHKLVELDNEVRAAYLRERGDK